MFRWRSCVPRWPVHALFVETTRHHKPYECDCLTAVTGQRPLVVALPTG